VGVIRRITIGSWVVVWGGIFYLLTLFPLPVDSAAGYEGVMSATPFVEPVGCWEPPGDNTRVWVNGFQLNVRTLAMLDHAQQLYQAGGGVIDFRLAITQGSYNAGGVSTSFGTHDAGGAVDLSVRSRVDWSVLEGEIEPMIRALRVAGFAAWLRDTNELYPESPIHIHAIAIGDPDLSEAARAQLDGRFGYLRGFNGLPQLNGIPIPDLHGGPVICTWMIERGFVDMRNQPNPYPTPGGTTVPLWPIP
jgi:hypothetical protein